MDASNSGLAHGTSGSPQTTIENKEAEQKAIENEAKIKAELEAKRELEEQAKKEAEEKAKREAEEKKKIEEEKAKQEAEEKKKIAKKKRKLRKVFQGNRTREEYSNLARDPARGSKVDYKSQKERAIILDLEKRKIIGKVIRDPQVEKGADFIDTKNGIKFDIKSPVSYPKGHKSAKKGAFRLNRMMDNVLKEINRGNKVIIDTRRLTSKHKNEFKRAIKENNLENNVIWYDKRGDRK